MKTLDELAQERGASSPWGFNDRHHDTRTLVRYLDAMAEEITSLREEVERLKAVREVKG